jgi:hypothetical protein
MLASCYQDDCVRIDSTREVGVNNEMNRRIVSVTAIAVLMTITVFTVASTILVCQAIASPAMSTREPTSGVLSSEVAYFMVGFPTDDVTFTIMLTDTEKIKEARDIASGVQTDTVSVLGTIVRMPAPHNPFWSYHLAPESIQFFDTAVEVCDAHPYYVEEHLDEVCGAFLPGCIWCPYSSRVIMEVHVSGIFLPLVIVDSMELQD